MDLPVPQYSTKLTSRQDITTLIFFFALSEDYGKLAELFAGWFYVSAWLGHGVPRYLLKHYSCVWVWLWGCLWVEFTLKSVDWESRLSSPIWEALSRWLSRIKRLSKRILSLSVFRLGHQSSSAFILGLRLELTPLTLLALRLWVLDQNYTIGSPGSPACWLQMLDFSPSVLLESIPDSKFLPMYICMYLSTYLSPIDCSLENSNQYICLRQEINLGHLPMSESTSHQRFLESCL